MGIKKGDIVKFHCKGRLENGEVVINSKDKEPIEGRIGENRFIRGLEEGLLGMQESEHKKIVVSPDRGFGQRNQELIIKASKNIIGSSQAQIGQVVTVKDNQGKTYRAEVIAKEDNLVTLDLNHPLAGRTLKLELEAVEIKS